MSRNDDIDIIEAALDDDERADSPSPEGAEPPRTCGESDSEWTCNLSVGHEGPHNRWRSPSKDADYRHAHIVGRDRCKCGASWVEGGGFKGYAFHLEDVLTAVAIEREAALPEPSLDALLLAAEEVDNSWYDDEGTVRWHPELWERLVALRRAHNAYEEVELARLRGTEGSHPDKCPVEGCDELPEDHRHIGPIEALLEKARLVSQWHGAMNSGPLEVLDAELGELGEVVARVKANG